MVLVSAIVLFCGRHFIVVTSSSASANAGTRGNTIVKHMYWKLTIILKLIYTHHIIRIA